MEPLHQLTDRQYELKVTLFDQTETLGVLMKGPTYRLGWFFLEALTDDGQNEWDSAQLAAKLEVSVRESEDRAGLRPRHVIHRSVLAQLVADGLGWLIARGLLGPAGNSSGSTGEWRVTTTGYEVVNSGSAQQVENRHRLHTDLHPALQGTAQMLFEIGDYDTAVFSAMKTVEVAVRTAARLPADAHGVQVMHAAFREDGPLELAAGSKSESEAFHRLFAGAYGAFRSPSAHRTVSFESATEAADILHLADLLLRIVERQGRRPGPDEQEPRPSAGDSRS